MDRYRGPKRRVRALDDQNWSRLAGREPTGSWYVRQDENEQRLHSALLESLRAVVNRCKQRDRLEELKIIELLYYRMLRNKEIAAKLNVTEQRVATLKLRTNERLRKTIGEHLSESTASDVLENSESGSWFAEVLADLWERYRISCPKRSTIGGYLLGTLERTWMDYVEFHLTVLVCDSCRANLEDLRRQNQRAGRESFRHRIMESTVGFLRSR